MRHTYRECHNGRLTNESGSQGYRTFSAIRISVAVCEHKLGNGLDLL